MRVVDFAPRRRFRWLALTALAAAGALAWRFAHRRPAAPPPPAPLITCAIPDVTLQQPHFAQPPPGDPYPRAMGKRAYVVEAVLVAMPKVTPACGQFLSEATMLFHPLHSNGGDLRVLVGCPEMTRA